MNGHVPESMCPAAAAEFHGRNMALNAEVSVVVPLYNEERILPTLHLRLTATLRQMAVPYEIIYVDDGSSDRTSALLNELCDQESEVRAIYLSRNFGHQAALCAGLENAAGRAVVSIDGDLQDPPELIPALVDKWHEGYQIVYARRRRRKENPLKRLAYFTFYRILRQMSELPIPLDTGDFALMDRAAVRNLNSLPERSRFIRGLRTWVGYRQTEVAYDRDARLDGQSKYTLRRLFQLAMDGIFAFSNVPLKAVTALGLLVIGVSLLVLLVQVASLIHPGLSMASDVVWLGGALGMVAGVQLLCLGLIGEYIARIHCEVRGRPLYLIRQRKGFEPYPRVVPNVLEFLPGESTDRQERATRRIRQGWDDVLAEAGTGRTPFPQPAK